MVSATLGLLAPLIYICAGAAAFALIGFAVKIISLVFSGVKRPRSKNISEALKKEGERERQKKLKPFRKGKVTAAKIIDFSESLGSVSASGRFFQCAIEYAYYDENGISHTGSFNNEIIPFFCDSFKRKGTLPVIFDKGKSSPLTRFPNKRK